MATELTEADRIAEPTVGASAIRRPLVRLVLALGCVLVVNGSILWFFHDHFWYAPDDGNYAHVAQRIVAGEVLNLQIQDVHAGYINFVNAAAFRVFGLNLLSLRYPLVFIAFVQAVLIFILFYRSRHRSLAIGAAIAINALGLVQFLNPTANWYSLFLVVLIACTLHWIPRDSSYRLLTVGFLLGTLVLFRQLSGVIVAMGVLSYLLIEIGEKTDRLSLRRGILGRSLIAITALGLGFYLFRTTDLIGLVLFGFCPLLILVWLFVKTVAPDDRVLKMMGALYLGGFLSSLPLVVYHIAHGSMRSWLNDSVFSALGLTRLDFIEQKLYGRLIFAGIHQIFSMPNVGEFLNGLYWTVLPLLAFINGILVLRLLSRRFEVVKANFALPVLAVFYGIVSVHFQIPIYLYYTAGFSLAGLLWITADSARLKYVVVSMALLLSAIGIYYHAAQPLSGRFVDGGRTIMSLNNQPSSIQRATLKIDPAEARSYSEILNLIEAESRPDETIFALPTNAELYFLSGRRNPFRFYNSALGIGRAADFEHVKETLINRPPKLVIYRPDDKYNTTYSREIIRLVSERYDFLANVSGFDVYRARQN